MGRLLAALNTLGAVRQRDGTLSLELDELGVTSLFGGGLVGPASCAVQGDALAFRAPPELAACGRLWLPDIADDAALLTAVIAAHDELRGRIDDALSTLRRLGFKARMQAPEPRARGSLQVDGAVVVVAIDTSGDLVIETVDGHAVAADQRRSLAAPEEATAGEAAALVADVVRASRRRAPPASLMSQEELDELQAALDSDEGLPPSDESERTVAGVPMPQRPLRSVRSDFDDGGTLQLPIGDYTHELAVDESSDIGTLKVDFRNVAAVRAGRQSVEPPAPTLIPAALAGDPSLLDGFDDDAPAPLSPVRLPLDLELDFDSDEADSFADAPEPTATRPRVAPRLALAPRHAMVDEPANDRFTTRAGAEQQLPPPPVDDGFDDFPALAPGVDGPGFMDLATSVNATDDVIASAPPTAAVMPSPQAHPRVELQPPVVSDFEDDVTAAVATNGTDDDFEGGKTRALVIDEALLARLKRGDAFVEPPVAPTADRDDEDDDDDDDDEDDISDEAVAAIGISNDNDGETPPAAAVPHDLHLDGDLDDALAALANDLRGDLADANGAADDEVGSAGSLLDNAPFDGGGATPPAPPLLSDDRADADEREALLALLAREQTLVRELDALRAQIAVLRDGAEVTDHAGAHRRSQMPTVLKTKRPTQPATPTPRSSSSGAASRPATTIGPPLPTAVPTPRSSSSGAVARPHARSVEQFAVVGASDDHSAEGETHTAAGAGASLPSLMSIDVHEIAPPPGFKKNDLLAALDDFSDFNDDGETAAAAAQKTGDDGNDDDLVSLVALQGALKEMGVDLETGAQTLVAPAAMPFAAHDDAEGDVFGSGGGASSGSYPAERSELSQESTRVRQTRPSSIGIVVEDVRARVRLRKHLVDHFAELVEAADASDVAQLRELPHLDAIVFVRPTDNHATRAGFARLNQLPRRPRVLVISSDDRFDEIAAVDLRLPLGLKASEVARQVLDGLERLGVQSSPAS